MSRKRERHIIGAVSGRATGDGWGSIRLLVGSRTFAEWSIPPGQQMEHWLNPPIVADKRVRLRVRGASAGMYCMEHDLSSYVLEGDASCVRP